MQLCPFYQVDIIPNMYKTQHFSNYPKATSQLGFMAVIYCIETYLLTFPL